MIIKNRNETAITELRRQALEIMEAGINRVLPPALLKSALSYDPVRRKLAIHNSTFDVSRGRIFVTGAGKAAGLMAQALESIISPEHISDGVVNCNSSDYQTRKIRIIEASHPTPDERGVNGVKRMLGLRNSHSINENDLVICLISGGGSALMPYPVEEISLEGKQRITELLLSCGAQIGEINAVRKHLSKVKGGRLGQFYLPATVLSLIISDVVGNRLETIASGPTAPDPSTFRDAYNVLRKYNLLSLAPKSVTTFLERGCTGEIEETPKSLSNCANYIIGDNRLALESMEVKARELGLKPLILTCEQKGETTAAAHLRAKEILNAKYADYDVLLIGGETTPNLPHNHGKGGRNQHYAAATMVAMKEYALEWVFAGVGTDGSDFLPDIAGAIVDNNSLTRAKDKEIDVQSYLDRYDSNTLFERAGGSLIVTGNTGTNVSDIMVYIMRRKQKRRAKRDKPGGRNE
jgi:hydroxypyruvate reductase/glycerate 2-kinase